MAIVTADLADDLGVLFGAIKEANTFRGATLTTRRSTVLTELGATYPSVTAAAVAAVDNAPPGLDGYARALSDACAALVGTVVEDTADFTIPGGPTDLDAALREWCRQMIIDTDSFGTSVCTASTGAYAPGIGDATFIGYVRDETGQDSDFVIPDILFFTLQLHADNGGTRWAETFRMRSRAGDNSALDAAYPQGHGLDTSFTLTDPASDGGLVSDPSFDAYASGAFTSWTRIGATTATHSFQTADDPRDGADGFCATLKGDGSAVPGLKQTVDVDGASHYAVHLLVKSIARPTATDVLRVTLRSVDDDSILTDDAGNSLTAQVTLQAAGGWATTANKRFTAHFVTPARLPAGGVYLDVRITGSASATTAPANLTEQRIDFVSLQNMTPLTNRGLLLIGWSGLVEPDVDDSWAVQTTLVSGTVSAHFIRWLDRTFSVSGRDFRFPTSGTPTVSDSVIV